MKLRNQWPPPFSRIAMVAGLAAPLAGCGADPHTEPTPLTWDIAGIPNAHQAALDYWCCVSRPLSA